MPKGRLRERFERFARGEWESLLTESQEHASRGSQASRRRRPREHDDDVARRAGRAEVCCPSWRVGLLHVSVWKGLPSRQGTGTRCLFFVINQRGQRSHGTQFQQMCSSSSQGLLSSWMWTVSHGTFDVQSVELHGEPSGMTADHLRPILESEADTTAMGTMATDLAQRLTFLFPF